MADNSDDKIIYALIGKNTKPLAEFSYFIGTFNQACLNYLKTIEPNTSKAIKIDEFTLFYINERNITFMILAGKLYPKEGAIGCLESIKREFNASFEGRDLDGETNFGLNDEFKEKLKLKVDYFNENKEVSDEKIEALKIQMDSMKDEILNASGLLDIRSDKIKVLDDKAELLSNDSNIYYRQSKRVRKAEMMRKIKICIGIGLGVLIIIYFIIGFTCGFAFQCARKK